MNDGGFPVEAVFRDNLDISTKHFKEIVGLIREREVLFIENLKRIVNDQIKWENKLLVISEDNFGEASESPVVISVEKEIMKLERDKRQEEVLFWQDTSKLRLMISEALKDQKSQERKVSLLSGFEDEEETPVNLLQKPSGSPESAYHIPMNQNYIASLKRPLEGVYEF